MVVIQSAQMTHEAEICLAEGTLSEFMRRPDLYVIV